MKIFSTLIGSFLLIVSLSGCKKDIIENTYQTLGDTTTSVQPEYVITKYGAVPDGKTDCSAVINNLIANFPASGGTIVIPQGEFLLNAPINVNRNFVTIRGLNPGIRSNVDVSSPGIPGPGGGSKLLLGNAVAGINVPVLPDVNGKKNRLSGLVIKDLSISGGTLTHGTGINILQDNDGTRISNFTGINLNTGISVDAADAIVISSCWVSECKNSIYLSNGIQNTINSSQLGAQPGGITVKLDAQVNFNFTGNQVYPNGDVNLQLNNSQYVNVTANNFQSYAVGIIELNNSDNNLISNNLFWMRNPTDPTRQLRGGVNDYGVIRVSGNNNLVSSCSISCDWTNLGNNPVTIRSLSGTGNTYQGIKITDTGSSRVFYVNETSAIFNCVPAGNIFVDGDPAKVIIRY